MNTDDMIEVPLEIIEAARKVENWMAEQGQKYWQLNGICDRRFVCGHENWTDVHLPEPPLPEA